MSVSSVAPTPFPQDPDRLEIPMPRSRAENGGESTGATDGTDKQHLSMFAEGDDSPSFWDFLDVINPLQHIPVVNKIYQELTGDKIGVGARLVGGTLFGGPVGLIASAADCVVEESTGNDTGGHVLAFLRGDEGGKPATDTMVASAEGKPSAAAATTATAAAIQVPATTEPPAAAAAPQAPVQAEKLANTAAPIIALPEDSGKNVGGKATLAFSLDGNQTAAATTNSAAAAPTSTISTAATAQMMAAAQQPMPLTAQAKFRPVPARTGVEPKAAQVLKVPVSTSQTNSNVPITGRNTAAAAVSSVAKQTEVPANHPMMPPTDTNGQTAASPDWFTSAWSEALDKYQRANRRSDPVTGGDSAASLN